MLTNKTIIALVASFFLLAAAPGAQAHSHTQPITERTLTPVEDASCGVLYGDLEYGCRMIFWGIYVADYQLVCEELGIKDLEGCYSPEEPPRGDDIVALSFPGPASDLGGFVICMSSALITPVTPVTLVGEVYQCTAARL